MDGFLEVFATLDVTEGLVTGFRRKLCFEYRGQLGELLMMCVFFLSRQTISQPNGLLPERTLDSI